MSKVVGEGIKSDWCKIKEFRESPKNYWGKLLYKCLNSTLLIKRARQDSPQDTLWRNLQPSDSKSEGQILIVTKYKTSVKKVSVATGKPHVNHLLCTCQTLVSLISGAKSDYKPFRWKHLQRENRFRKPTLYPTELRARKILTICSISVSNLPCQLPKYSKG